ncbi:MAG: LacI family transcriptional regulator [Chloroflexi bacterium]|nr:LacI family transcriptional regulator [Chloroflexota bacterium]
MASIMDLARRAQVSPTTVSRVLNNSSHPVSEAVRQRVLQAARELDYRPNALARAMITRRTQIVGVIVGDSSDPYFSTIVRGIETEARAHGYLVIICNTDRDPLVEQTHLRLLHDYQVDGIIFAGGSRHDCNSLSTVLDELRQDDVALVALNPHTVVAAEVRVDNVAAAREMTEHLLALGHRRIALIGGPEELTTTADRLQGYRQALAAAGVPFDPELVWPGAFTFESGVQAARRYLATADRPTALFAANDQTAIGAMAVLRQAGIRIPEDVSVAGFDDIEQARYVFPTLTTISVPMHRLGVEGMRHLLDQLAGKEPPELLCLPYCLQIRDSTGPPLAPS